MPARRCARRPQATIVVGHFHGSVHGQGRGGGGCGGEGGGVYVPSTRRERRSYSPPVHRSVLLVTPVLSPLLFFSSFFFCKNRATIADNVVAFRGTVCQWYAEPEYPDEMRIRPHPALGQYRVFRNRFHPATICVGRLDAFAETMPERFYIAQENESKNTSNGQAEPE